MRTCACVCTHTDACVHKCIGLFHSNATILFTLTLFILLSVHVVGEYLEIVKDAKTNIQECGICK
jgi:hypothetical protein